MAAFAKGVLVRLVNNRNFRSRPATFVSSPALIRCRAKERNEDALKKLALVMMLLFSALAWAGGEANPADYNINVRVSSSRLSDRGLSG